MLSLCNLNPWIVLLLWSLVRKCNGVIMTYTCLNHCSLSLLEATSIPRVHLSGPDGHFQTQEPAILQLQGHPDHLPDLLRGHVWWRLLLQWHLPWGYSGEDVFNYTPAPQVASQMYEVIFHIKSSSLKGAVYFGGWLLSWNGLQENL